MIKPLNCFVRFLVRAAALAFLLFIAIGFLGLPRFHRTPPVKLDRPPRTIVVLGGGGIPSESGLIRTYYAAKVGTNFPGATFIVSLPCVGDPATNSVGRMRDELVMRGVPAASILMEHDSFNTHEQAVNVRAVLGAGMDAEPMMVVTSPYHLKRALLCFRKVGFTNVAGVNSFNTGAEIDFGAADLASLRYTFWANLHAGVDWVREAIALAYYRYKGWI